VSKRASALLVGMILSACEGSSEGEPLSPKLSPGVGPAITIQPPTNRLAKNSPTSFTVRYRDLPSGSGLVVALVREVRSHTWEYSGETGPLTLSPVPVAGSGALRLPWNVRQVGCAPSDAPEWCSIQPGRYRVDARVYDRASFGLLGMVEPDPPPTEVAASTSMQPLASVTVTR